MGDTEEMNRILFEASEISNGCATFGGVRAEHVLNVLHGEVGQMLKTGVVNGRVGTSRIEAIEPLPPSPETGLAQGRITVTDKNDNYASGKTDKAGQITVPTGSGVTNEDGKVTVGYEDADGDRWTLTVKVIRTDTKRPISGSAVSIGKTGNITVKLPSSLVLPLPMGTVI